MLHNAAAAGLDAASKAFEKQGWLSTEGWLYGAFGIIINILTGVLVATGGAFIIHVVYSHYKHPGEPHKP